MNLQSVTAIAYIEDFSLPLKVLVNAVLTTASKETRFFWLIFDSNDDQLKIIGILQNHWRITTSEATTIYDVIIQLKKDPFPIRIKPELTFSLNDQNFQIMTDDGSGKRLVLSSPICKKYWECKPRDKRWIWVADRLDPMKFSQPTKSDLLNLLGCSVPKERAELITKINSFFDGIKPLK